MNQEETVDRFYKALARCDAETMADCYADNAEFSDPAFPRLNAEQVRGMWRMLCSRSKDLRVEYVCRKLAHDHFQVQWDAWYTFSKTGRPVHNRIQADIRLQDGKIVVHRDSFSFWRWSIQALGLSGLLLGWSPLLRTAVRAEAGKALQTYLTKSSRVKK